MELKSLLDYPDAPEVLEDGDTFYKNALKKGRFFANYTGETVIADDSGLEVDCLNGVPGVYSARYAGPSASDEDNIEKLLHVLDGVSPDQRTAAFRCVLVLCDPEGNHETFEGILKGVITKERRGSKGFGYDPVFFYPECGKTVAELSPKEKNRISHRGQAFSILKKRLQEQLVSR